MSRYGKAPPETLEAAVLAAFERAHGLRETAAFYVRATRSEREGDA